MDNRFRSAALAQAQGRLDAAEAAYRALLADDAENAAAIRANLAAIAVARGDGAAAEAEARAALAESEDDANGWNALGLGLKMQGRAKPAVDAFRAAVAGDPRHAEAWANLGGLLAATGDRDAALKATIKAVEADPDSWTSVEAALYLAADVAEWGRLDDLIARARRLIARGAPISPYALFSLCTDPEELLRAARNRAGYATRGIVVAPPKQTYDGGRPLRVGYFSSTLRAHATGYLLRQVIAAHDPARVRIAAYVYGERAESDGEAAFTRALCAPFADVIDLTALSDEAAAAAIRADAPDVVLDIDGYANGGRPGVLAHRPAPRQIAWLGHLGTMGAPFIDRLIADEEAVPPDAAGGFDEDILRPVAGFFPGDGARVVSDRFKARVELGLPEDGVVFCAFNQPRKITPPMLDVWAALVRATPGSVLWLWDVNPAATRNLRAALAARGVADRAVFAPSLPSPDHLCRYRFADVVLDAWPYNGHTMTSDALYMGAPVVTRRGATLPSRVAASLIARLGLSGALVADDREGYAARALALAQNPDHRKSVAAAIRARAPAALFDPVGFAKSLEAALVEDALRR